MTTTTATIKVHLYASDGTMLGVRHVPLRFQPGEGFTVVTTGIPKRMQTEHGVERVASIGLDVGSGKETRHTLPG